MEIKEFGFFDKDDCPKCTHPDVQYKHCVVDCRSDYLMVSCARCGYEMGCVHCADYVEPQEEE